MYVKARIFVSEVAHRERRTGGVTFDRYGIAAVDRFAFGRRIDYVVDEIFFRIHGFPRTGIEQQSLRGDALASGESDECGHGDRKRCDYRNKSLFHSTIIT